MKIISAILISGLLGFGTQAQELLPDPSAALVAAAIERTQHRVRYVSAYLSISYPMGDVPDDTGVCTDVVIRSYRALGVDLQQLIHEDMAKDFDAYPNNWGLTRTDRNIDHRRVPNIRRFLERQGASLPVSENSGDYLPGDVVSWNVGIQLPLFRKNVPHVGIITDQTTRSGRPLIVHNIGRGPKLEDKLFAYPITGHYRYLPAGD